MSELPSGTVTFLFTDIEGSTELLKRLGRDRYESVLAEHAGVLRAAVAAHGGRVVDTQGDSLFCAFRSAREAVSAAIEAQRELAAHEWPEQVRVRVRMGLHSGEPKAGEERVCGYRRASSCADRCGCARRAGAGVGDGACARVGRPAGGRLASRPRCPPVEGHRRAGAALPGRRRRSRGSLSRRCGRCRAAAVVACASSWSWRSWSVAGGAAAAVLLSTGSASAKPVRLVANSIAVIDPKSGKPVGDVPLAFSPSDVDAGGDEIWVLNGLARTATAIDPRTLKVVQTVGLDGDPYSQYATGGTEWVGLPRRRVDEVDSNGVTKIPLWRPPSVRATSGACFVYVTGDGRSVWVSRRAERRRHRRGERERSPQAAAARPPPDAAPGGTCYGLRYTGGLLACDPERGLLDRPGRPELRLLHADRDRPRPRTGTKRATPPVPRTGRPASAPTGSTTYTVSTTGRQVNFLDRLDPVSGEVTNKTVIGSGTNVASDPASGVWVGGRTLTSTSTRRAARSPAPPGSTTLPAAPRGPSATASLSATAASGSHSTPPKPSHGRSVPRPGHPTVLAQVAAGYADASSHGRRSGWSRTVCSGWAWGLAS